MDATGPEQEQRARLADVIERRAEEVIARWLEQVRADAAATHVSPTDLRDGIHYYLQRLAELLRGGQALEGVGASAWTDVAHEHALTRVRLGFDVVQLFHELVLLRRVTTRILGEEGLGDGDQLERVVALADAAIASSLKSYIDFRDFMARRAEAEHIGFLTHELKNPLAAAVLAAQRLRQHDLSPAQLRLCEILDRNLERIREMVDGVLLTERLQAGEVEPRPVDLTLGEMLRDALEVFHRAAGEKRIALGATYDRDLPLRADRALTLSAIENLLDNAIKYTDQGEVRFEVEERAGELVFHVRDQCGGLSPEELRVIFEPFRRIHSGKPGTGLGLAIARRAIEAQGGAIHAESTAEAGCHFWFTLPRA